LSLHLRIARGRFVLDDGAAPCPVENILEPTLFMNRKNDYRYVIFARKCNRSSIHDCEVLAHDTLVAQALISYRIRILARIGGINPVDLGSLEQGIGTDLRRAQRCSGIG